MPPFTINPMSSWDTDFSGQLNQMLAPYQQMTQGLTNPYATMRPESWLARQHPTAARFLDNALLPMGMTPESQGPEGVGGGISRAVQGLMGAQQYRRQQALMGAMLPYQMFEPRLRAEDTLAQIRQRGEQARYERSRGEWYENRIAQMEQSKYVPGTFKIDDEGKEWQEIFDPIKGRTRLFNPSAQKYSDELKSEEQPSFEKSLRQERMSTPGGLLGEIMDMRMSSDPAIKARGEQMGKMYTSMTGGLAGARTAGEQDAPHPYSESRDFLGREYQQARAGLPKTMSPNEYQTLRLTDPDYWKDPQKAYETYAQQGDVNRQKLDLNLGTYEKSGVWKRGVSFQQYISDPSKYDNTSASKSVATTLTPGTKPKGW